MRFIGGGHFEIFAIARQRAEKSELGHVRTLESGKRRVGQRAGHLARTVGAEIHEHAHIAIVHARSFSARGRDRGRFHEFIILSACISSFQRRDGIRRHVFAFTLRNEIVRGLYALPALITVHRVIAADDGGNTARARLPAFVAHEFEGRAGAARRRIAAVEKRVHADLLEAGARRHFDHRRNLRFMAVHAARRHQAKDVQGGTVGERRINGLLQDGILEKLAAFNVRFDPRVVLVNHASRPNVQVPDLRIAHLRGGQADPFFRGIDGGMRIRFPEKIPVRFARLTDRVVGTFLTIAKTVEYDQQHRGYIHDF